MAADVGRKVTQGPYCGHTGKIVYPTPKEAGIALRKTERRRPEKIKRHVYRCRLCGGYHFGKLTNNARTMAKLRKEFHERNRRDS